MKTPTFYYRTLLACILLLGMMSSLLARDSTPIALDPPPRIDKKAGFFGHLFGRKAKRSEPSENDDDDDDDDDDGDARLPTRGSRSEPQSHASGTAVIILPASARKPASPQSPSVTRNLRISKSELVPVPPDPQLPRASTQITQSRVRVIEPDPVLEPAASGPRTPGTVPSGIVVVPSNSQVLPAPKRNPPSIQLPPVDALSGSPVGLPPQTANEPLSTLELHTRGPSGLLEPLGDSLSQSQSASAVREGAPTAPPTMAAPSLPPVREVSTPTAAGAGTAALPPQPPFGQPVPGRRGLVYLPGLPHKPENMIDVSGIAPGTKVRDPESRIVFRVP